MLVFLLLLVEIKHLLYQIMYLSSADQSIQPFLSLLFLSRKELIILLKHLVICEPASHAGSVECALKVRYQLPLTQLASEVHLRVFLLDFCGDTGFAYLLEVENGVDQLVILIFDFFNEGTEVRALKEEFLVLVKQIVDVYSVGVH